MLELSYISENELEYNLIDLVGEIIVLRCLQKMSENIDFFKTFPAEIFMFQLRKNAGYIEQYTSEIVNETDRIVRKFEEQLNDML